jgi:autotransporter-associated beta strand protein
MNKQTITSNSSALPHIIKTTFTAGLLLVLLLSLQTTQAGSATWNLNPASGDWNTATNWTPATVPNGPTDVATFAASSVNQVTFSGSPTEVAEVIFNSAATSSFNITIGAAKTFTISGVGVVNNSDVSQNFSIGPSSSGQTGLLNFENTATAGTANTTYTAFGAAGNGSGGSGAQFFQNSTAGSATFIAQGATHGLDVGGGFFGFNDNSTAENASFTINGAQNNGGFGGSVGFGDFATAGNAVFVLNPGNGPDLDSGAMGFRDNATAGNAVFRLNGATVCCTATEVFFQDSATGGNGFFTVMGGQGPSALGGEVQFWGADFTGLITTAGNATIINEGGTASNARGGITEISAAATAGQALIVANGGTNGGGPGEIFFFDDGEGGEAQIELHSDGYLDISYCFTPGVTIGSLAGDGFVYTGARNLTVGSNNFNRTFSGTIQENGGIVNDSPGSLTKIGTGTLTLSGASTYRGGTTIMDGILRVKNTTGSATGTKAVLVNAGTLGGGGIIAGPTTIGTGSGAGAFLAPGQSPSKPNTLTIQNTITFKSDSTYTYVLNTKKAKANTVIANGVSIDSGAQFNFDRVANKKLTAGTIFTAITNTSANPISGTFANLPDNSTFTSGRNNYQVSYEGGDGNDLTLTVVP